MKAPTVEIVFLVRMWVQGGDGAATSRWRGDVLDVYARLRITIVTTGDIEDFIDAQMEERLSE